MEHWSNLITQYGYIGLLIALVGGIVGLPIPDEVLLTFVGYNIFLGNMTFGYALLTALIGTTIGITISFLFGIYLGFPFLRKFGPKLHISAEKIAWTQKQFNKFGALFLFFGYFIPGVRHVTAYIAGISSFRYGRFALFAYTGALFWTILFLSIGRILGSDWTLIHKYFTHYILLVLFISICTFFIYWYYQKKKNK